MTLIELLFNYRDILQKRGRRAANEFLECADPDVQTHIIASVDDKGQFIKADGTKFDLTEWEN